MGHGYTPDYATYCRIGSRTRSYVFDDAAVVGGNLEFVLEWDGGYIEPYLDGANGVSTGSKLVGLGGGTRTLDGSTPNVVYTGTGAVKLSSAGTVNPSTNGFNGQTPWIRAAALDVRFTLKAGSGVFGLAVRYSSGNYGGNHFKIEHSGSTHKFTVTLARFPTADLVYLTSAVTTTLGESYDVRVTATADSVWEMFVDGVSQGTFTDASYTDRHKFQLRFTDTNSELSNLKFMPVTACPATSYEVINNEGVVVSSGSVAADQYVISVPDADLVQRGGRGPYGGYKLRLYGADDEADYGTAKGDCQFVRVAPADNFPALPTRYDTGPSSTDNDLPLRCYFGLGASRIVWNNNAAEQGAYLDDNYRSYAHPDRPRHSILHFSNLNVNDAATMTATVVALKDYYDAWEPLNEPNYSGYTGTTWVPKQQIFYDAVKAGDASATALGPNPVSYNWLRQDPWIKPFFTAGGAAFLDEFSVHGYNCTNGDIHMAKYLLGALREFHTGDLTLWQTEQSFFSQFGTPGVSTPLQAHTWLAVQLMVQETLGIPLERNVLWYDKSHGFAYTSFWEHGTGVTSVPVMVRTMVAEFGNRVFDSEYDLGDLNDAYVCAKWSDTGDGTAVVGVLAQSDNLPDVRFTLTGATSVACVDAYGNEFTINATAGVVTIPAQNLPHWVRLPAGVDLALVAADWVFGTNYAVTATVTAPGTAGVTLWNPDNMKSQFLENNYMFTDGTPGTGTGYTFQQTSQTFPQTYAFELAAPQTVGRINIFCPPVWQVFFSTLVDFDVDVYDGASWTTVYTGTPPAEMTTSAFVSNSAGANTTVDQWYQPPIAWDIQFYNQTVTHVRVVVRDVSYGNFETSWASEAMFGSGSYARFTAIRGVRIYENPVAKRSVCLARAS